MKTNMNICKLALLLVLCLGQATLALADAILTIDDFSIAAGETKELSLMLSNDQEATVLQADIVLPEGLSYVPESVAKTDRITGRGATVQASTSQGFLRIIETDGKIAAGEGAIITFQVTANNLLAEGNHTIKINDIVVSDADASQINTTDQTTCTVTALGLGTCTFAAATTELEMLVGDEAQIDITLANDGATTLSAFSGTLALPAGLQIVEGEDGKFIYSERTPAPMEFRFTEVDGKLNFLLSSSSNTLITGIEGVIFSFKVKATDALAESKIVLSNLRVAATNGQSATCDDVTIAVTRGIDYEALALEAAQEQLDDLQAKAKALAVSEAAAASNNATVAAAVTTANDAIDAAKAAVAAVQAVIDKGELATTNKEELANAITAANTAIADANTAIAAAETALKDAETPVADVPGDIGGDGEVDDEDVDLLIDALLDNNYPTDPEDPKFSVYDVNGDGEIDIADAQAAFNLSMGLNIDGTQK